jgi:hypothetical protein
MWIYGQTDRHEEANHWFSKFFESARRRVSYCRQTSHVKFFFKLLLLLLLLWLYNSLCSVLAFSTISFHLLSWTKVFQFGTFSFCISFLTSSSQRVFGPPIGHFEMGLQACIALTILVSCILSIWPSHPNLCTLCSGVLLFIQFLVGFYSPNIIFIGWTKYFPQNISIINH